MPLLSSLLLEVFEPASLEYDAPDSSIVAWEVSTDPAHDYPYLLAPREYATQEIDPIQCTSSIGQVEVGVIDVPEDTEDQSTGWMTARVGDLFGRRCRLSRYINEELGWVVIADGPAAQPAMDQSYAAYRWTIRDTRETERKLTAFMLGGSSGIVPRGPLYGFGRYTNDAGDQMLLAPLLDDDDPVWGTMQTSYVNGRYVGKVDFASHYVAQVDPDAPTAATVHIWQVSLNSINTWANGHRANGDDPYDMSSGNGNQGLDAIIVANGITVADFNTQATALGISFGPGTAWIEGYRDALVTALGQPTADPLNPFLDDTRLDVDEDAVDALQTTNVALGLYGPSQADVLWRVKGTTDWNLARPVSTLESYSPFVVTQDYTRGTEDRVGLTSVLLYSDPNTPSGFPTAGAAVEIIIRYRGAASEAFPFYVEGMLGHVLMDFYDGVYSTPSMAGIEGDVYDPAELNVYDAPLMSAIRYDADVFETLTEQVLLRQTEGVDDGRSWAESALYAPSGWIPTLDRLLQISPRTRTRPSELDPSLVINDDIAVPAPNWQLGSVHVSSVEFKYPRYFVPANSATTTTQPDGLAIRPVILTYEDPESDRRYGTQKEEFDASAFAAIGDSLGANLSGQLEQGNQLAQTARFEVLQRYRAGVPGIALKVRRQFIPDVCAGDWVPYDLSWLPNMITGLRSAAGPAQIISIRDDDTVWRTVSLELVSALDAAPGYVSEIVLLDDEAVPGYVSHLIELADAGGETKLTEDGLVKLTEGGFPKETE